MGLMKRLAYDKILLENLTVKELELLGYDAEKRKTIRQAIKSSKFSHRAKSV